MIAQCERVGRGVQALQYLARYLHRGVISNHNIIDDDGEKVTFRYRDSQTQAIQTRTLPGDDFMALLLQHVLPKGLHRARDYGFLHGNAKRILKIVQWVLRVSRPMSDQKHTAQFRCPHCHGRMFVSRMTPPTRSSA
jgi:DNA-directed RNA polymerase subunit RPC12/RpoP